MTTEPRAAMLSGSGGLVVMSFLGRAVAAAGLVAGVLVGAVGVPEAAASTGPVMATMCASCGKVAVYSGGTLLATVNLHSATTVHQAVFTLPKVSLRAATVTLKVVTSRKTIQIDGLGVIRT